MNTATNDNKPNKKKKERHTVNMEKARPDMSLVVEYTPDGSTKAYRQVSNPLKLDKLLNNRTIKNPVTGTMEAVLNAEQHGYGLRFIALYMAAHPQQRTILARMMERIPFGQFTENEIIGTITAKEQFNLLRTIMIGHYHPYFTLVRAICIDEKSNRAACKEAGILQHDLEIKSIRAAFDFTGDCLQETRHRKAYLEKYILT